MAHRTLIAILGLVAVLVLALVAMALTDAAWLGWVAAISLVLILIVQTGWEWGRDWPKFLGLIGLVAIAAFVTERVF